MTGKDGYFLAKRQLVEAIDTKILDLKQKIEDFYGIANTSHLETQVKTFEDVRSYVRNVMLWDTKND